MVSSSEHGLCVDMCVPVTKHTRGEEEASGGGGPSSEVSDCACVTNDAPRRAPGTGERWAVVFPTDVLKLWGIFGAAVRRLMGVHWRRPACRNRRITATGHGAAREQ